MGPSLDGMLAIVVNLETFEGKAEDAIAAMEANAAGSRKEPGCLKWEWSRQVENPNKFAIYELYKDEAAIDFHRASPHFALWREATPGFMKEKTSAVYEVTGVDTRPVG